MSHPEVTGKKAYSIAEFCAVHGISRASYYNLKSAGQGPIEMQVFRRVLISEESASDWRRRMESNRADA